jgi:hypothetical protein
MICVPRSAPKWLKISATLSFFIFAGFPLPQAAAQPGPAEFRVDRILPAWLSHRASSVKRTGSRLSGSECGTADPSLPLATVVNSVGGEVPGGARNEACTVATIPQGTQQVHLFVVWVFHFSAFCQQNPADPACAIDYDLALTAGNTEVRRSAGAVTPASQSGWQCVTGDYGSRSCLWSSNEVLSVAGYTEQGAVPLTLRLALEGRVSAPYAVLDAFGQSGIEPLVEAITFDYAPGGTEGVTLRIDGETDIEKPEWRRMTKEKKPSSAPYDAETSAPAAFVAGRPLRAKVRLWAPCEWESAVVRGLIRLPNGSSSPYGEIPPRTVAFDRETCQPVEVEMESSGPPSEVAASDLRIEWQLVSFRLPPDEMFYPQGVGYTVPGTYTFMATHHRVYTLYREPVAPMQIPWAKVLELSANLSAGTGASQTERQLAQRLADGVFYSRWLEQTAARFRFFQPQAPYIYDPMRRVTCALWADEFQKFPMSLLLERLADSQPIRILCADNANFHAALAASQGLAVHPLYFRNVELGALIVTRAQQHAGDSAKGFVDCFNWHQLPALAGGSWVYDISVKAVLGESDQHPCTIYYDDGHNTAWDLQYPGQGTNFFDLTFAAYLSAAFQGLTPQQTYGKTFQVAVGPCPVELSPDTVMLTATALEWDPAGGYWRSTLTITNIGSVPIELPVQLVLRDLPPEIVLNRTGTVQASGGEGAWPYFLLGAPTGSLAPGGTMSVEARFSTSNAVIQWFALSGKLY